jgi:hypothetical protein
VTQEAASYDRVNDVLDVKLSRASLHSREDIDALFAAIRAIWGKHCKKRVYVLADYSDFGIDPKLMDHYSECVKGVVTDLSIAVIRYSDQLAVRTQVRAMAIKIHRPSSTYTTRDEALVVVNRLRTASITMAPA